MKVQNPIIVRKIPIFKQILMLGKTSYRRKRILIAENNKMKATHPRTCRFIVILNDIFNQMPLHLQNYFL